MSVNYKENPYNMSEIIPYIITEKEKIIAKIFENPKCYFYDTCSFRKHANSINVDYILKYIKEQNGIIVITRCILMELASHSGVLNQEYVKYFKRINELGIAVLVIFEEVQFSVMEVCFSTNNAINNYLCWAVRTLAGSSSAITKTLELQDNLNNDVIKGKNLDNSRLYTRFFGALRGNKESGDNLGEEMIALCLHILSHIPGEDDGKFCVITDDKGAAGKIDNMFKKTAKQYKGRDVGIFSTPKLVQVLNRENILLDTEHIREILGTGTNGNIIVLGNLHYDIRARDISLSKEELANLIVQPNGINILF